MPYTISIEIFRPSRNNMQDLIWYTEGEKDIFGNMVKTINIVDEVPEVKFEDGSFQRFVRMQYNIKYTPIKDEND